MSEEKDDLKKGEAEEPSGDDQPDKSEAGDESKEEEVTLRKSEYDKIVSDRDNYRAGLLKSKAQERDLKKSDSILPSAGGDKVDVDAIAEKTSQKVLENLGKVNESKAKVRFLKDHPEFMDDVKWGDYIYHFASKRGKATMDDILEDMEDAMLSYKRSTGELDSYLKAEREKGRREGGFAYSTRDAGNAGGIGDQTKITEERISPEAEIMAQRFGHDAKKLAKIDLQKERIIPTKKLR